MTKETCIAFFENCARDTPNNKSILQREKGIEALFAEDRDNDGKLTDKDFLRFYHSSSIGRSEAVWKNLQAHDVGHDLLPEPRHALDYKNDQNVTRDQSILPRCQIANNSELLEVLFSLDQKLDTGTSEQIWDLISSLKTNRTMYMNILTNNQQTLDMLSDP